MAKPTEDQPTAPIALRPACALAFATGFLYFLAFPGIDLWPLAFVALVPLILALRGQTPRRALLLGWVSGFTMTMIGFYWLLEMLQVFSGFPLPICVVFMAILCGYQGGRIALAGWLYGRASQRGWPAAPAFALAFVTSELVFPLLFPWYYGATVHNAPLLLQLGDIGGPYLVGLVLVAVNLAIAELVDARRRSRAPARAIVATGAGALVVAAGYGALRIAAVDGAARVAVPVKIGIVQGNQPLIHKPNARRVHASRTRELKNAGVDLVIWSEGASGQAHRESTDLEEVRQSITQRLGVPTIIGTVLVRPVEGEENPVAFNTALLAAGPDGKIVGRYDKHYLLAFGEYLPFGDSFPILYKWSPNSSHFSPGTSIDPLVWGDHKIATLICYEDILPSFVNDMVRHGDPDLLVNLTNDAWFGDSTEPWIHFALAKLRAVEHRRYLVRATNSGVSAIIDPVGRVAMKGGTYREEALIGVAKFMRTTTVYERIGDVPWYLATAAIGWMAIRKRRTSP